MKSGKIYGTCSLIFAGIATYQHVAKHETIEAIYFMLMAIFFLIISKSE